MSCTCGNSYIVKSGDTLALIAERELGDGSRWREITKQNCTPFTEDEARRLQPGDEVCLPNGSTPTPPPPGGGSFADIVSRQTYESMFPNRNSLYSYDSLVSAAAKYPDFCNQGTDTQRRQEAAAFLANISHETSSLVYIEELRCIPNGCGDEYCSNNTTYPCVPGRSYHGRGPMQLSWNYNYGAAGQALGLNLLDNPDQVKLDGTVAFSTALWFWMTRQEPKPSCHEVMSGGWTPNPDDVSLGRTPGFGMTINIINGGLECGIPTDDRVRRRVEFYTGFCQMLGVTPGDNLYCNGMRPY